VVPALHVWVQPTELLHTRLLPGVMAAAVAKLKSCPPAEHYRRLAGADEKVSGDIAFVWLWPLQRASALALCRFAVGRQLAKMEPVA